MEESVLCKSNRPRNWQPVDGDLPVQSFITLGVCKVPEGFFVNMDEWAINRVECAIPVLYRAINMKDLAIN